MGLRDRLSKKPEPATGSFATGRRDADAAGGAAAGRRQRRFVSRAEARASPEADREDRPGDDREAAARTAARRAAPDPEPAPRAQRPAPEPRRARADGRGAARRGDRPRAARAAARRHDDLGHHGERLRHLLHRALRQARADADPLPRQRPPAADHHAHRLARRAPHRRIVADGRRPLARRRPRQRHHPAARDRRAGAVDSPFRRLAAAGQGHGRHQQRDARRCWRSWRPA